MAGHTDNVQLGRGGRFADNWDLSAARALNVVRFLATNNVAAVHLGGAGYGEYQPALANDTDEHRAQNRRVEIILMPNIEGAARPLLARQPRVRGGSGSRPCPGSRHRPSRALIEQAFGVDLTWRC